MEIKLNPRKIDANVTNEELDVRVTNLETITRQQNLLLKDILEELKTLNFFLKYKLGD